MVRSIIAVTALLVAAMQVPWAAATEHESMSQQIQQAKTAADHEALATQYDKQASEAKEKAAEHRKMAA